MGKVRTTLHIERMNLPFKLEEAVLFIEKNYNKLITLETLSAHLRMDRRHLSRQFKARVGITPMNYLENLRLTRAKELLSDSNIRVRDVANRVGIPPTEFLRWFKRKTRFHPKEYRKETDETRP